VATILPAGGILLPVIQSLTHIKQLSVRMIESFT
jgi:hypothetical protein